MNDIMRMGQKRSGEKIVKTKKEHVEKITVEEIVKHPEEAFASIDGSSPKRICSIFLTFPNGIEMSVMFIKRTLSDENIFSTKEWEFDFARLMAFLYWGRALKLEEDAPDITLMEVKKELKQIGIKLEEVLFYVLTYAREHNLLK